MRVATTCSGAAHVPGGGGGGGGGGDDDDAPGTFSSLFGDPAPASLTLPTGAVSTIAAATAAGDAVGTSLRRSATAPVTWGAAIDVPLFVVVAVSEVRHADRTTEPGANRSTHVPKFENDDRASVDVVEPTVRAGGTRAGDLLHASYASLPAETT